MGFNVGISAKKHDYDEDLYVFINRSYYNFVASFEALENNSVLVKLGEYLKLDLTPLIKLVYTWDVVSEEYIDENLQTTDDVITLVELLYSKLKEDPDVFSTIDYLDGFENDSWNDYATSGQAFKDLENVIRCLKLYKNAGYNEFYFTAG